jgi:hypothetical protein
MNETTSRQQIQDQRSTLHVVHFMEHGVMVEPDNPNGRETGDIRDKLGKLGQKGFLEKRVVGRIQIRDLKPEHQ